MRAGLSLAEPCAICQLEIAATSASVRVSIHGPGPEVVSGAAALGAGRLRSLELSTMHLACVPATALDWLRKVVKPAPDPIFVRSDKH